MPFAKKLPPFFDGSIVQPWPCGLVASFPLGEHMSREIESGQGIWRFVFIKEKKNYFLLSSSTFLGY
jgi:hypothetical protein